MVFGNLIAPVSSIPQPNADSCQQAILNIRMDARKECINDVKSIFSDRGLTRIPVFETATTTTVTETITSFVTETATSASNSTGSCGYNNPRSGYFFGFWVAGSINSFGCDAFEYSERHKYLQTGCKFISDISTQLFNGASVNFIADCVGDDLLLSTSGVGLITLTVLKHYGCYKLFNSDLAVDSCKTMSQHMIALTVNSFSTELD